MSNQTWTQIASISGIAAAVGGTFSEVGKLIGGDFGSTITDIGSVAGGVGRVGIGIAGAGQFATASQEKQEAALTGSAPLITAITASQQATSQQAAAQSKTMTSGVPVTTRQEAAAGGLIDLIGAILALPLKLLKSITG